MDNKCVPYVVAYVLALKPLPQIQSFFRSRTFVHASAPKKCSKLYSILSCTHIQSILPQSMEDLKSLYI